MWNGRMHHYLFRVIRKINVLFKIEYYSFHCLKICCVFDNVNNIHSSCRLTRWSVEIIKCSQLALLTGLRAPNFPLPKMNYDQCNKNDSHIRSKIEVHRDVRNPKSRNITSSGENGLNIRTIQVPNGTGPGVRRSKRPLLATNIRCKCSLETFRNMVIRSYSQWYGPVR